MKSYDFKNVYQNTSIKPKLPQTPKPPKPQREDPKRKKKGRKGKHNTPAVILQKKIEIKK